MEPLDLEAGPALDTLIAGQVMRWTLLPAQSHPDWTLWESSPQGPLYVTGIKPGTWRPSTDANDAVTVLEHLSRFGWELSLSRLVPLGPGGWIVRLMRGRDMARAEGRTLMEAFCRTALLAARGKV